MMELSVLFVGTVQEAGIRLVHEKKDLPTASQSSSPEPSPKLESRRPPTINCAPNPESSPGFLVIDFDADIKDLEPQPAYFTQKVWPASALMQWSTMLCSEAVTRKYSPQMAARAFMRTLFADQDHKKHSAASRLPDDDANFCKPAPWTSDDLDDIKERWFEAQPTYLDERRFFTTDSGHMGLGP